MFVRCLNGALPCGSQDWAIPLHLPQLGAWEQDWVDRIQRLCCRIGPDRPLLDVGTQAKNGHRGGKGLATCLNQLISQASRNRWRSDASRSESLKCRAPSLCVTSMLVCLRTFDPEEADYFFVPTMAGCLYDVYGWNQIPMWPPKIHGGRGMCVMCDVWPPPSFHCGWGNTFACAMSTHQLRSRGHWCTEYVIVEKPLHTTWMKPLLPLVDLSSFCHHFCLLAITH